MHPMSGLGTAFLVRWPILELHVGPVPFNKSLQFRGDSELCLDTSHMLMIGAVAPKVMMLYGVQMGLNNVICCFLEI